MNVDFFVSGVISVTVPINDTSFSVYAALCRNPLSVENFSELSFFMYCAGIFIGAGFVSSKIPLNNALSLSIIASVPFFSVAVKLRNMLSVFFGSSSINVFVLSLLLNIPLLALTSGNLASTLVFWSDCSVNPWIVFVLSSFVPPCRTPIVYSFITPAVCALPLIVF